MQAGNAVNHADMVQLMLEASENKDENGPEDRKNGLTNEHANVDFQKKYLTEDEMISNSFVFLLAGFETTANCLGFTAYLLAKYPEIQQRLYEEIEEVFGSTDRIDYEQAQKATYLEMVISESLRLFPPVTRFGGKPKPKTAFWSEEYTLKWIQRKTEKWLWIISDV